MRTDENLNPTAFITDVARTGGLVVDVDYTQGTEFKAGGQTYHTAKILLDPLVVTIKLMDHAGFYTRGGSARWVYSDGPIGIPHKLWMMLTHDQKVFLIGILYQHEGGTAMRHLFPGVFA